MNTTHRALPDPVDLPPLPAELWLNILERACTAGIFSPFKVDNVIEFSISATRKRNKLYRQSLVTKRYVVQVCKQWSALASPYLYEHVRLSKRRSLCPLRDGLTRTFEIEPRITTPTSHTLGCCVKQLDIALRDDPPTLLTSEGEIDLISDIIRRLPNLTIVNFCIYAPMCRWFPASILDSLMKSSGPTLQAATWQRTATPPEPHAWRAFLGQATNMTTLVCPNEAMGPHIPPLPVQPSLHSLQFSREPLFGEFPSLRHVIGDAHPGANYWQPFLEIHGPNLEVIQLNVRQHSTLAPLSTMLCASCPRLARLDISVSDWDLVGCQDGGCQLLLPNNVRVLGLQNAAVQAPSRGYTALWIGLKELKLTPSLHCIQFTDGGNVNDLRHKHFTKMKAVVDMLKERGLELRDHEGFLMI